MAILNSIYLTQIGILEIKATSEHITAVLFTKTLKTQDRIVESSQFAKSDHPLIHTYEKQLEEYFNGQRMKFDLPIKQEGSPFQQKVWAALTGIPYGSTLSYFELSSRIGNIKAIRAVGTSNGKNSLSIIVPCHRVIGKNGELTGYAGDLWRKKWLLDHEGKYANCVQTLF